MNAASRPSADCLAPLPRAGAALFAVVIAWAMASSSVQAQSSPASAPATAVGQLDAIRGALTERALAAPTRVRSSAWIDEQGRLHETTRIESGVTVRGVRVLGYLEDERGVLARLTDEGDGEAAASPGKPLAAPKACPSLRRHAWLSSTVGSLNGRQGLEYLPTLASASRARLEGHLAADPGWALSAPVQGQTRYERVLLDPAGPAEAPYALTLGFDPVTPGPIERAWWEPLIDVVLTPPPQLAPRAFRLSLRLTERRSGRLVWERQAVVDHPAEGPSLARRPLPEAVSLAVNRHLDQWQRALVDETRCEPLLITVAPESAGLLRLDAGQRIGLRAGDRLVLVDVARLPARTLEAGELQQTALLEVQSLRADQALVKILAGTVPSGPPVQWAALPL
jgi:hypothetical protein